MHSLYIMCISLFFSGSSSWLDFMDEGVRKWWVDQFSLENYEGSAHNLHIWNDMNEPSVFNTPELTFPKDIKHLSGRENREVHNAYAMMVVSVVFLR